MSINKDSTQPILLCFLFFCFFQSCQDNTAQFIPERQESINKNQYENRRKKLIEAYAAEDYYHISFYLATLQAPKKVIYDNLKKAIKNDTSACSKIFEVNYLAEQGFYRRIYRVDTTEFKKTLNLCLLQMESNSYDLYKQKEAEKTRLYLASREPLDSALFDRNMMEILKKIDEDDQEFRRKARFLNISDAEKERLFNIQDHIDSINLLRVDSILTNYGYPTKEKVGHDYSKVITMVIHHQSDLSIRQEYLDRIRAYIGLGAIEMIERRTQHIIQDQD